MNASWRRPWSVWDRFWFAPESPHALALCRITGCVALLSFLLAEPAWLPTSQLGVLGGLPPEFWRPIPALELLHIGPPSYASVGVAFGFTLAAVVLLALGLFTRASSLVCAAGAFYLLAVRNSWGKIYHDYHVLMVVLLVLAVSDCGAALSLDRYRARAPAPEATGDYRWPVKLIQLSYALMFAFAAYNKLADGDGLEWIFSENLRNTLLVQNFVLEPAPTLLGPWVARHRVLWTAGAAVIVLAQAMTIGLVFIRQRVVRAALFLLLAGFIAGRTLLMGMPEPIFAILALVFVDWDGVRVRIENGRSRASTPAVSA
jgi:uncharacterized membrane protein YphA (DoxX/SURF4 family)